MTKAFSKELADDFYEKFEDSSEALIFKDYFYFTWGAVAIKVSGRSAWYYPYSLIRLCLFGVNLDDLLAELPQSKQLVDIYQFIATVTNAGKSLSIKFRNRDIEVLKTILTERNETSTGIITYNELAGLLGINRNVARDYWLNLYKFFHIGIYINYGKLGLFPVLVRHVRELTTVEKQYTKASFHNGHYYSLLFIPRGSRWVQENERVDEQFTGLGSVNKMVHCWNLTHFTGKTEKRWGSYPGLNEKKTSAAGAKVMMYNRQEQPIEGLHIKDFRILRILSQNIGRLKDAASYLGVSESYYSQRVSFLAKNEIFVTKVYLWSCGLDVEVYIALHSKQEDVIEVLQEITNALTFFPHVVSYTGDKSLLAKIKIPQRWLKNFILEVESLTEPGGHWNDIGLTAAVHLYRSRTTINSLLTNLDELILNVEETSGEQLGQPLVVDWSFELPPADDRWP